MLAEGKVSASDLDLIQVVDDPDEVVKIICAAHSQNGGKRKVADLG